MPKMNILTTPEQETFDSPPELNSIERKKHFDFPMRIRELADQLRTLTNKVCFLVASAYFSATKKFYSPNKFRQRDIDYVCQKMEVSPQDVEPSEYNKQTLLRHQQLILEFYGFKEFHLKAERFIQREVESMLRSQLKPKLILFRVMDLLTREKTSAPSYHRLSKLILNALSAHKKKLIELVETNLSSKTRDMLDELLEKATDDEMEPINRYRLTLLKKCSQSTRPGKIKGSVEDLELLRDLHDGVKPVLDVLELPYEAINYYANSVIRSEI